MEETLQKIKEMVYRYAEQAADAPIEDIVNQERDMNLSMQFKILDTLNSIDSRLISVENAVSNVEEAVRNLNHGRV